MDDSSKKPLYLQIEDTIIEQIKSNIYQVGDSLPSLVTVAESFGVGMITARKAFDELYYKGYLTRKQGRQAIVAIPQTAENPSAIHLDTSVGILYNGEEEPSYERGPWGYTIISSIQLKLLKNNNLSTLISVSADNLYRAEKILKQQVDSFAGFIYLDPINSGNVQKRIQETGKPYVIMGSSFTAGTVPNSISFDYYEASSKVAEYFIAGGMKSFIHLMPQDTAGRQISEKTLAKIRGFQETLLKNKININNISFIQAESSREGSEKAIALALEDDRIQLPVGIFAAGDYFVMGVCDACIKRKLKPKKDFMAVGSTGLAESAIFTPPLSVIETPMKTMGEMAVDMIYEQVMKKTNSVPNKILTLKFIERGT